MVPAKTKEIENMNIKSLGANKTILTLNNGDEVFFSYSTPVAAFVSGQGYLKTSTKYSSTTSKHINAYAGKSAKEMPQEFFDNLAK